MVVRLDSGDDPKIMMWGQTDLGRMGYKLIEREAPLMTVGEGLSKRDVPRVSAPTLGRRLQAERHDVLEVPVRTSCRCHGRSNPELRKLVGAASQIGSTMSVDMAGLFPSGNDGAILLPDRDPRLCEAPTMI